MRRPRTVTLSALMVTTLPLPLPRISAPGWPTRWSGLLMVIGPGWTPRSMRIVSLGAAAAISCWSVAAEITFVRPKRLEGKDPGSARVPRAGRGVPPRRTFSHRYPPVSDCVSESSSRQYAATSTRNACATRSFAAALHAGWTSSLRENQMARMSSSMKTQSR